MSLRFLLLCLLAMFPGGNCLAQELTPPLAIRTHADAVIAAYYASIPAARRVAAREAEADAPINMRPLDINDDGIADWRVEYGLIGLCGTGGCLNEILVSRQDGTFDLAMHRQALTVRFQHDQDGNALLRVSFHDGVCWSQSGTQCVLGFRWDERHRRFADVLLSETAARRYDVSLLDLEDTPLPSAIFPALRAVQQACANGRKAARPAGFRSSRSFDFDGDGRLDWLVGNGAHCSPDGIEQGRATPVTVWLDRDGTPQLALTVSAGFAFVDVSGARPVLGVDCRHESGPCSEEAYIWEPAVNRLQRMEPAHLNAADAGFLTEWIARLMPGGGAMPVPEPSDIARARSLAVMLESTASPTDSELARARLVSGAMLSVAGLEGGLEKLRLAADQLRYQTGDDLGIQFRLASAYRARAARATDDADDRYYGARDAILYPVEGSLDGISRWGVELAIEESLRSGWVASFGSYELRDDDLAARPGSLVGHGIMEAYRASVARTERRYGDASAIEQAALDQLTDPEGPEAAYLHRGMAKSLLGLGKLDQAEDHARIAARLRTALPGANRREAMAAQIDLAMLLLLVRRTSEAEAILRDTVATLRAEKGDNYMLVRALRGLADAAIDAGRARDASEVLAAARIEEERLGARDVIDPVYSIYEATEVSRLLARSEVVLGNPLGAEEFVALVENTNFVGNVEESSISALLDAIEFGGPVFTDAQLGAMVSALDAPGKRRQDIAARAVDIAEQNLPGGHPWIARARRLLAQALIIADDPAAGDALTAALDAASAQQQDGRLGGLEIRNDAVRFYLHRSAEGDTAQALHYAREAVSIARNRRAALGDTAKTGLANAEMRRAYIGLVAVVAIHQQLQATPDAALADEAFRAFQEAEQSQAAIAMRNNVLRALAEGSKNLRIATIFNQYLTAEREHAALGQLYLSAITGGSDGDVTVLLQRQAAARKEMERTRLELATALPRYRDLASDGPLPLAEVQGRLRHGQGLYLLGGDGQDLVAMLIGGPLPRLLYVPGGAVTMARDIRRIRCMLDRSFCTRADLSAIGADLLRSNVPADGSVPFDLAAALRIGKTVLSPFAADLAAFHTLYVVQQGRTADLPLAIVPLAQTANDDRFNPGRMRSVEWLIDRAAIVQLPSASVLLPATAPAKGISARSFIGIGNPALQGDRPLSEGLGAVMPSPSVRGGYLADVGAIAQLSPLPETQRELEGLARAMGSNVTSLITGLNATETRVKADKRLLKAGMITFATHGLMPGDFDGLAEPGLVMTPPPQASSVDDGLLLASEVARFDLRARQVLLSACNTASANGPPGADSLSALARAFLVAGAETVIASRWSLLDDATAALSETMARSEAADPTLSPAAALRDAMIAVRRGYTSDGKPVPGWDESWSHPRAWGAFILVAPRD